MSNNNYIIDDNSADTFENLYRFMMSASVKDIDLISEAESSNSRFFSETLKKYYNDKLTDNEIKNLLLFVDKYNKDVTNYLYDRFYSKVLGITKNITDNSMLKIIASKLAEKYNDNEKYSLPDTLASVIYSAYRCAWHGINIANRKDITETIESGSDGSATAVYYINGLFTVNLDSSTTLIPFKRKTDGKRKTEFSKNFNIVLEKDADDGVYYFHDIADINNLDAAGEVYYLAEVSGTKEFFIFKNSDSDSIIKNDIAFNDSSNNIIYKGTRYDDSTNIYTDIYADINNILTGMSIENTPATASTDDTTYIFTRHSPIFINFQQFLINIVKLSVPNDIKKNSATEKEISLSMNDFPYSFFEIHNAPISSKDFKEEINIDGQVHNVFQEDSYVKHIFETEEIATTGTKPNVSFIICYKELNSKYREYEYSAYTDLYFSYMNNIMTSVTENNYDPFVISKSFITSINNAQPYAITDSIRNLFVISYTKNPNYNYTEDTVYNLFNCIKTNPYKAIISPESAIITYFSGSNEQYAFAYGDTTAERTEISNFLYIYENVREYFYKVLSSRAFVNEDFYKAYEKIYIAVFAIIKTLDYKASNYKDIDSMNETDIDNFLKSYGLGVLTKNVVFANQSDYKRMILKHYNELMKAKGSKEVIDLLSKVFDVSNTDIDIKKYELRSL